MSEMAIIYNVHLEHAGVTLVKLRSRKQVLRLEESMKINRDIEV